MLLILADLGSMFRCSTMIVKNQDEIRDAFYFLLIILLPIFGKVSIYYGAQFGDLS
jgi:hypothetical protein